METPVEAGRVEEAEQPAPVASETVSEAVDELPGRGKVPEVATPADDDAVAEAPIDVSLSLVQEKKVNRTENDTLTVPSPGTCRGACVEFHTVRSQCLGRDER